MLAAVNATLADHGVNIEGQLLGTRGEIGYVVTDVGSDVATDAIEALARMPQTVRLRVLA